MGARGGSRFDAREEAVANPEHESAPSAWNRLRPAAAGPYSCASERNSTVPEGRKPRTYLSWRPAHTTKPNFHVPQAFGVLVIDDH